MRATPVLLHSIREPAAIDSSIQNERLGKLGIEKEVNLTMLRVL